MAALSTCAGLPPVLRRCAQCPLVWSRRHTGTALLHGPHTGPVQPPASCSHLPLLAAGGGEVLRPAEVLLQAVLPAPGMPHQDTGMLDMGEMTW